MQRAWFEISNEGWRRLHAYRPLGALLGEALQNAFDEDVTKVTVEIKESLITIEDNGSRGFADERLVYTIFMTDKAAAPHLRGRQGRGLKELISATNQTTVETPSFTIRFDDRGRHVDPPTRKRGTLLTLYRQTAPSDIDTAVEYARLLIPPAKVKVTINGKRVRAPAVFATLPDCLLPTLISAAQIERMVDRSTPVTLYHPRTPNEMPHLFEMGLPIARAPTPWHIDVGQRVPRQTGSQQADPEFQQLLLATLFESMVGGALPNECLHDSWLQEVLSWGQASEAAVRTYVHRVFPPRSVLPASQEDDDRARQEGAHVVDAGVMDRRVVATLARVMETSHHFVTRRQRAIEEVKALHPSEERVLAFYRHLARQLLGHSIKIRLVRRPPTRDGFVESATFDPSRSELRINILGKLDLNRPLSPISLGILFHELAHAKTSSHDFAFIENLQQIAGQAARLLLEEGADLLAKFGLRAPPP